MMNALLQAFKGIYVSSSAKAIGNCDLRRLKEIS
jgi:hypothetical protein